MPGFYEFFAGGGMARAGLGPAWKCLFANDFDQRKARAYRTYWGDDGLRVSDVREVTPAHLPPGGRLAWASFPCQDLSLAGSGAGLNGHRSGTFWTFWKLMEGLKGEGRAPEIISLENVTGTLTSHGGADFSAIVRAFSDLGYLVGAVVIDAVMFVPQSRPRLFIIGLRDDIDPPPGVASGPSHTWHPGNIRRAYDRLGPRLQNRWLWWDMPLPPPMETGFSELVEAEPSSVEWHTPEQTARLIEMMSDRHRAKLSDAKNSGSLQVGTVYKRTRRDPDGNRVQRAEVRFDDVAGCLRTPAGGSSRQLIMVVEGEVVRSRLVSTRETARLMGLPDKYPLPENYNEAYHLTGDGVVVPVVRHLAAHIIEPTLAAIEEAEEARDAA